MDLLVFGHAGTRILTFPTSEGRYYDWERFGMIDAVADELARGVIQLFCVDSVDAESWYARDHHPRDRVRRHIQYDQYLHDEVLPFSSQHNPDAPLFTAGCSLGAYHAVTFALRYPQLVQRTIGMSGLYDITRFARDYTGADLDAVNPVAIIANEDDPDRLEALRRLDIILAVGNEPLQASNVRLSELLWDKRIPHTLRASGDWVHDWPSWAQMLRLYLDG
jgi:esterase/lipase superfamily enzyme